MDRHFSIRSSCFLRFTNFFCHDAFGCCPKFETRSQFVIDAKKGFLLLDHTALLSCIYGLLTDFFYLFGKSLRKRLLSTHGLPVDLQAYSARSDTHQKSSATMVVQDFIGAAAIDCSFPFLLHVVLAIEK